MSDDNRVRLCLRLRDDADHHDGLGLRWRRDCREAADVIERQAAELGRLRAALRDLYGCVVVTPSGYLTLVSDKKTEEAHRRAAVALGEGKGDAGP